MTRSTTRPRPICASWRSRVAAFVALNAIPVAAKWLLIGRWKEEVIPIWSLRYFRFWLVKDAHPQRAVGVLRRQPALQCLFAAARRQGRPQHGDPVQAPAGVHRPDLDRQTTRSCGRIASPRATRRKPTTSTPDRSASATTHSSARRACSISTPAWKTAPSSATHRPCRPASASPEASATTARPRRRRRRTIAPSRRAPCTPLRRALYSAYQLFTVFAVILPVAILLLYHLFPYLYRITSATLLLHEPVEGFLLLAGEILLVSAALFVAVLAIRLLSVVLVPRLLHLLLAGGQDLRSLRRALPHPSQRLGVQQFAPFSTFCSATAPTSSTISAGSAIA